MQLHWRIATLLAGTPLLVAAAPSPITPVYEGNCQAPRWSPDGAHLAYEVNYHARKSVELFVMESGQSARRVEPMARSTSELTAGFSKSTPESVSHELTFSPPELGAFLFSASGSERDYDLYLDGGSRIAAHVGTDGGAAWSPDGKHIVFTSARTGQGDLYLLDTDKLDQSPRRLTADEEASELYASWSPDGQMIVFVGHTRMGDNLYLIDNIAYPAPRPITSWSHTQTRPTFSPDGSHIAFYSNHEKSEQFDLYVMPVGGNPRLLRSAVVMNAHGPAWLPNSRGLIVVVDDDERFDPIFKIGLNGTSRLLNLDTIGNGDHAVATLSDQVTYLAIAAQGTSASEVRDFKRLYIVRVP